MLLKRVCIKPIFTINTLQHDIPTSYPTYATKIIFIIMCTHVDRNMSYLLCTMGPEHDEKTHRIVSNERRRRRRRRDADAAAATHS